MGLVVWLTGCDRVPRYDQRLVQADSLMQPDPDSALAIVEAVNRDSLADEGDRAYRDLLLTQARYRCYIVATSDSDINRALSFYRRHSGEREKLTRAYIFKGAVMDELGYPDSAMYYYKHAEATAAPDDYFNLGYINMRIATLYQNQFSQDTSAIARKKRAIRYFEMINDTNYLISCYGDLGGLCGIKYPDSTEYYLKHAIELAEMSGSPKQFTYKSTLAGFIFFHDKDYLRVKDLAMEVLRHGKDESKDKQFYMYATISYIKLGKLDSAKYVFSQTPAPIDGVDSMAYFDVLAEFANAENNLPAYKEYQDRASVLTERSLVASRDGKLTATELMFENQRSENDYRHWLVQAFCIIGLMLLALVLFVIGAFLYRRVVLKRHENQMRAVNEELENTLAQLRQQEDKTKSVSASVSWRLSALNELFRDIRVKIDDADKTKKVVPLTSVFRNMTEHEQIMNVEPSALFWERMELSVNGEYNGILDWIRRRYTDLGDREMKMLCLMCAGLSPQIIRLCMNMTSPRTVTNNRSLIIKKKMGLDMSLDTFIEKYMNGDFADQ